MFVPLSSWHLGTPCLCRFEALTISSFLRTVQCEWTQVSIKSCRDIGMKGRVKTFHFCPVESQPEGNILNFDEAFKI